MRNKKPDFIFEHFTDNTTNEVVTSCVNFLGRSQPSIFEKPVCHFRVHMKWSFWKRLRGLLGFRKRIGKGCYVISIMQTDEVYVPIQRATL